MIYQHQITIHTSGHGDMHDLTEQVSAAVANSGIQASAPSAALVYAIEPVTRVTIVEPGRTANWLLGSGGESSLHANR